MTEDRLLHGETVTRLRETLEAWTRLYEYVRDHPPPQDPELVARLKDFGEAFQKLAPTLRVLMGGR